MNDLMIDLETLGTEPDCPVISIGACFFDLKTQKIGEKFYIALDVSKQIEDGRKPSGDTLRWWMEQGKSAKSVFREHAEDPMVALMKFCTWLQEEATDAVYAWGNGSTFDISILQHMMKQYRQPIPWEFYNVMDLRTFRRFKGNNAKIDRIGTHHNALDDAESQALYVIKHFGAK